VLATAPLPPLKITLKLVNTTIVKGKPKAVTVATIKPTNVSASVTIGDAISLSISGDVPDKTHTKPFCGEHFSGEFEITNALDLAGRLGGTPINTMALSGPLTIAPVES
jgi:hypothetical protein